MNLRKLAVFAVLAALVAGAFFLDLDEYLTLEQIKQKQAFFSGQVSEHPWRSGTIFFLAYVALTALSFPGTLVLTLLAGALFGVVKGTLIVSFASTLGAVIAMLVCRYLMRDWIKRRFGQQVANIDRGIRREGSFYLFSLRLMPLIPFVLLNPVMGLTQVRFWTYWWTTQAGMLPGNAIYVNAGRELRQLQSVSGILSPTTLATLVLLAVFPLLARKALEAYRAHKVYKPWPKPRGFDRNLVVIGAGAGGLIATQIAARTRARVTLIERRPRRDGALYSGCVPVKALIRRARQVRAARAEALAGLPDCGATLDFAALMAGLRPIVERIEPQSPLAAALGPDVELIESEARITSPWTVEAGGRTITTRAIVLATGSRPRLPDIPGLDTVSPLTSDNLWSLDTLPARLLVVGGGPAACELAQAFRDLGSAVTLVNRSDTLLRREDDEAREAVLAALRADGIEVCLDHRPQRFEADGDGGRLVCRTPAGDERALAFDRVLVATGRVANLEGLGLDALGLNAGDEGTLEADDFLLTRYPNIYAVGDVAGPFTLGHATEHQARRATFNALYGGFRRVKASYRVIPWVTYTRPEVAQVGLTERQAREQGLEYEVTRIPLAELDRAILDGDTEGFVKVLTVPGKDTLLGATLVGGQAGEQVAEFTLAMKHRLGLAKLLETLHVQPSYAEASRLVARAWQRQHLGHWLQRWTERLHRWQRGTPRSDPGPAREAGRP